MTKLLICGSRKASKPMIEYTARCVERAAELGWRIVVGDAVGVDLAVIYACIDYQVPCAVFGITPEPRNFKTHQGHMYKMIRLYDWLRTNTYTQVNGDYLLRDCVMVGEADRVLAIWNGYSRGTKYTYDFAVNVGKQADLRIFSTKENQRV